MYSVLFYVLLSSSIGVLSAPSSGNYAGEGGLADGGNVASTGGALLNVASLDGGGGGSSSSVAGGGGGGTPASGLSPASYANTAGAAPGGSVATEDPGAVNVLSADGGSGGLASSEAGSLIPGGYSYLFDGNDLDMLDAVLRE